jgi:hypothetical protein
MRYVRFLARAPFDRAAGARATAQPEEVAPRPSLPRMPQGPARPGVLGAILYVKAVAVALLARRREERFVLAAIVEDQRSLDAQLAELGRTARAEARHSAPPGLEALAAEMRHIDATEDRLERAGAEARAAATRRATEAERWTDLETRLRGEVARKTQILRELGRGSPEQEGIERELGELRAQLAEAVAEGERALRSHDDALVRWQSEGRNAAAEQTQRQVHVGTLLNLHRVAHPRLDPLYEHIDGLKARLEQRGAEVERLRAEREVYDHAAVHNGLLAIAAAVAVLVFGALALVVLLVR